MVQHGFLASALQATSSGRNASVEKEPLGCLLAILLAKRGCDHLIYCYAPNNVN